VRREGETWVHYDSHIKHDVVLFVSHSGFTHSVTQIEERRTEKPREITWEGMKHCPICGSTNYWNTKEDTFCISCKYFVNVIWIPILFLVISLASARSWQEALSNSLFSIAFGLFLYGMFHRH
jgi:hypothetical protein